MKEILILLLGIGLGILIAQTAIQETGINLPQPEMRIKCTEIKCDTIYNYKFLK